MELLPQWLAAAGRHGYRAPAALVPALLDAARARTDLRPQALALAGTRGLWLARLNPDWRFALRGGSGGAGELPAPTDAAGVERLWQEGLFAERVALLGAVRAHEAAAALRLLSTTWSTERAEDRLMFLDSLRVGLSPGDEPFLEAALADRSRNVRATAAELLSALPESALAGRMAERALVCVGPEGVTPPAECDAGMLRDGVVKRPPAGRGERAWWLAQLVEAAPLSCWQERFGGLGPAEIVALPTAEGWAEELHAAWCRAAVRQRDPAWSEALLGSASAPPATGPATASLAERAKLLSILGEEERAAWVAEFIRAHGLSEAFQLLGVCVVPWAGELGRAVVEALDSAREAGGYPWSFSGVMGLAERCLDPAEAGLLDAVAVAAAPAEPGARRPTGRRPSSAWSPRSASARRCTPNSPRRVHDPGAARAGAAVSSARPRPCPSYGGGTGSGRAGSGLVRPNWPGPGGVGPLGRRRAGRIRGRYDACRTCPFTQATISVVVAPGVKISATPFSFSGAMSASGMIPPPNTLMSAASRSARSSSTRANSVLCAPERIDRPIASASSWIAVSTICSGVWWRPV